MRISAWIEELIREWGYVGLAAMTFLENVFPPIPSEVIMPLGGALVAQNELNLFGVILAGVAGSVMGALVLYYVGRGLREDVLAGWVDRHGKWLLLTRSDIHEAFGWFEKHGRKAVFICRLVPGVRSLISIPAGASGMAMGPFLLLTTLGTALWSGLLAYAGQLLGRQYKTVSSVLQWATVAVVVLLVVSILWYVVQRRREQSEQT